MPMSKDPMHGGSNADGSKNKVNVQISVSGLKRFSIN
jgi:hypothetical protein